jgi:hypothetical protein
MQTTHAMEDFSKPTRMGFEDKVETPDKWLKVLEVFSEFKSHFGILFASDQAVLAMDKVVIFLAAVDVQD